jgi:hypothetical protein
MVIADNYFHHHLGDKNKLSIDNKLTQMTKISRLIITVTGSMKSKRFYDEVEDNINDRYFNNYCYPLIPSTTISFATYFIRLFKNADYGI